MRHLFFSFFKHVSDLMCVDVCGLNDKNGLHLQEIRTFSLFYLHI